MSRLTFPSDPQPGERHGPYWWTGEVWDRVGAEDENGNGNGNGGNGQQLLPNITPPNHPPGAELAWWYPPAGTTDTELAGWQWGASGVFMDFVGMRFCRTGNGGVRKMWVAPPNTWVSGVNVAGGQEGWTVYAYPTVDQAFVSYAAVSISPDAFAAVEIERPTPVTVYGDHGSDPEYLPKVCAANTWAINHRWNGSKWVPSGLWITPDTKIIFPSLDGTNNRQMFINLRYITPAAVGQQIIGFPLSSSSMEANVMELRHPAANQLQWRRVGAGADTMTLSGVTFPATCVVQYQNQVPRNMFLAANGASETFVGSASSGILTSVSIIFPGFEGEISGLHIRNRGFDLLAVQSVIQGWSNGVFTPGNFGPPPPAE